MATTHKDECPVSAGQPAKTLTKAATDFIAKCFHPQGFLMRLPTELMHLAALFLFVYGVLSLLEAVCKAR